MSSAFAFLFPKCVVPLTMLRQHSFSIPSLITATELDFFNFLFFSFLSLLSSVLLWKINIFLLKKKININISSLFYFLLTFGGSFISLGVYHSTTIIRKLDLGVSWFLPPQNINASSFHSPFLGPFAKHSSAERITLHMEIIRDDVHWVINLPISLLCERGVMKSNCMQG